MEKPARNIEREDPERQPFDPAKPAGSMDEQPLNSSGGENPEGDDHQGVPPGRSRS